MPAKIEVEVEARDDAVALTERLAPYRPSLVQSAPTRWRLQAEAPGGQGESIPQALAAIEETLAERQVEDAPVRVNGQLYWPPNRGGRRSAADASPRVVPRSTRKSAARTRADQVALTRERNHHLLPHGPVVVSSAALASLVSSSKGYDDVHEGDAADLVQFSGRGSGAEAVVTFTHVVGKSEGTISVLREYEHEGTTKIGTRELAFRTNRVVYDQANPDGPDVGFLTAVGAAPPADGRSAQPAARGGDRRVEHGRTVQRRRKSRDAVGRRSWGRRNKAMTSDANRRNRSRERS